MRALRAVMRRRVSVWVHKHDKHDQLFAPQRFFFVILVFINLYKLNIVKNYIVQDHSRLQPVITGCVFKLFKFSENRNRLKVDKNRRLWFSLFGQVQLGSSFFLVA